MKKLTTQEFISKARSVHGDRYRYSGVVYQRHNDPVTIQCTIHGKFDQRPSDHINGRGCPECSGVKRWNRSQFIERATAVHLGKYSYCNANYVGVHTKTSITCPIHGDFLQSPGDHVNKSAGCPVCAKMSNDKRETKTTQQFIIDAKHIHGDMYDYQYVNYAHSHVKVAIVCPIHGVFNQAPNDHTNNKTGCPACGVIKSASHTSSKAEIEISELITRMGITVINNDRSTITPFELDILIPDHNIAIEYCGLYWHSEQQGKDKHYHRRKHDMCAAQGIVLITIFEDEWRFKQPQVISKLKSMLGCRDSATTYARNTTVVDVDVDTKRWFFNNNHIQGNGPGSINLGLCDINGRLVAVMSFIQQRNQHYLNRYATSCNVPGGFSKLLKHFQTTYNWNKIISFADQRWSTGNLYHKTGWRLDATIAADYSYSPDGINRVHKFNYRRKYLPTLLNSFDPNRSEWENCADNGVLRIWDCGKLRFVIDKES